jgi:hypothetical protein
MYTMSYFGYFVHYNILQWLRNFCMWYNKKQCTHTLMHHIYIRIEIHIYETILFIEVFWIVRQIQISHRRSTSWFSACRLCKCVCVGAVILLPLLRHCRCCVITSSHPQGSMFLWNRPSCSWNNTVCGRGHLELSNQPGTQTVAHVYVSALA